jgi:hypothetical protein
MTQALNDTRCLADRDEVRDAIREFSDHSFDHHRNYAQVAGVLSVMLEDAIMGLPQAQRQKMIQQLYRRAQDQKNEILCARLQRLEE